MAALFVESVILARLLGVTAFGDYAVVLTMITIFSGSISIRTQEALTKVLASPWKLPIKTGKEYIILALALDFALKVIVGGALYAIVLVFLSNFVELDLNFSLIAIIAASTCIFSFPNNVWNSIARLDDSFVLIATVPLAFPVIRLFALWCLVSYHNPSVELLILIFGITAALICLLQFLWICNKARSVGVGVSPNNAVQDFWSSAETESFLNLIKTAFFITPLTSALKNIDVLLLGFFGTSGEVGIFKVAKSAAGTLSGIQSVLSNIVFRNVVQIENDEGLEHSFWQTTYALPKIYVILSLPFFSILTAGTYLLPMLFGEQFSEAIWPFWILGLGFLISAGFFWVVSFVLAMEKFGAYRRMMWANAAVSLLLTTALTYFYGLIGAASGTAMAYIIGHVVFFAFLHHYFRSTEKKGRTKCEG